MMWGVRTLEHQAAFTRKPSHIFHGRIQTQPRTQSKIASGRRAHRQQGPAENGAGARVRAGAGARAGALAEAWAGATGRPGPRNLAGVSQFVRT